MHRIKTTLALIVILTLAQGFACDKGSLISNAEQALKYAKLAQPTIARLLPGSASEYAIFISHTERLVEALKGNDTTTAQAMLDLLLPIFNEIVDKRIANIQDANIRTIIMTALALVDTHLHALVDGLIKDAPTSLINAREADTIKAFARRESWGKFYRRP